MLTAIIVDDEKHCQEALQRILKKHQGQIELIGTTHSVVGGQRMIEELDPDVVFLDVHLKEETGFDLLKRLSEVDFFVVFTTAYEEYAVNAFKYSAFDYLLKPIDPDELYETIQRMVDKKSDQHNAKKLEALFHNFENKLEGMRKIAIPTLKDYTFLNIPEIVRCESDGNYTQIFSLNGKKITSTRTLKYFEDFLGNGSFFRIHKSHFVNLVHVEKYIKGKGGYVVMSDGTILEVAVRRKEEFLRRFGN